MSSSFVSTIKRVSALRIDLYQKWYLAKGLRTSCDRDTHVTDSVINLHEFQRFQMFTSRCPPPPFCQGSRPWPACCGSETHWHWPQRRSSVQLFPWQLHLKNGKLLMKHPKKTLGSINCCVCLSGRLFFFCYKMTHPGRPPEWPTGGPACGRRTLRTRNTQYGPQPFLYENLFSIQCKCHRALDDWFHSTALLLLQWWCWWFLKLEITQVAAFLSHRVQCVNCEQGMVVTINFTLLLNNYNLE